ncbi:MAG: DUF4115 domain-containing protein [Magnetovibrio sp.]|nr:DUF4115 domain-containing protein [Magnetovibrio sp.]
MNDKRTTDQGDTQSNATQASVGVLLRETRERAGLGIADVARVLRISQKYLDALEDGRNCDLPGTPYAIGFVRSYAEHLHLDGDEIVRHYKNEAEGLAGRTELVFPKPIPDGGVPGTAVLGLGIIIAAMSYGGWYWNSNQENVEIVRVESVPEHMLATPETPSAPVPDVRVAAATPSVISPVAQDIPAMDEDRAKQIIAAAREAMAQEIATPTPAPVATPEPIVEPISESSPGLDAEVTEAAEAAEVVEPTVKALAPSVEKTVQDAALKVEAAEEQIAMAPAEAEKTVEKVETVSHTAETAVHVTEKTEVAAVPVADSNGPSRVTVHAKEDSWISIRDAGTDRLLFARVLSKGASYDVPNRENLRLMTGNAGALELLVDGNVVPAIGGMGETLRNVRLDPDQLKSGDALSE